MFPPDDICLRCSLLVVLCTTTLAAPGGFGSFAGSSASAFSSANSNAQAGSLANAVSSAHAVSSANAFAGGLSHAGSIPSNNPFVGGLSHGGSIPSNNKDDVNHQTIQHPAIFAGTGSYVGYGSNKPGSDKFGVTHHQISYGKDSSDDNKSHAPCAPCQKKEDKWEKDDEQWENDEQDEEKESEQEEKSDDSYDDGQYRPEHHYYGGANVKEAQSASGIHKIGDNHSYDYNQQGIKGGHTSAGTNKQEDNGSFHGNIEYDGGYGSKLNQHSSHPTDVTKQKENGYANTGTLGSIGPHSSSYNKDRSTNAGGFGVATDGKTNVDSASGINIGCSNTRPGSNCGTSGTDSSHGPIKLDQSGISQTPNVPVFQTETNKGPAGCGLHGNCGNVKPDGAGQYPSTPDNKGNIPNVGNIGIQHKPQLPDQQSTGQGNIPNVGNIGIQHKPQLPDQQSTGPGCTSGESCVPHPSEVPTIQKTLPIPTRLPGGVGSGTFYPGGHQDSHGPIGAPAPTTGPHGNIGSQFPHGSGTAGFPQHGVGIQQPVGSGNCGTFGGSSCTSNTGYPGSTGITGGQIGQDSQGQIHTGNVGDGHVDKQIYQVNKENPFLFEGKGTISPVHATSSPVHYPMYGGVGPITDKPIGLGNPFLDGSLGTNNGYGTQNENKDQSDHNNVVTTTAAPNKPIGMGNPFLTPGHGTGSGIGHADGHGGTGGIGHVDGHGNGQGIGHGNGHGNGQGIGHGNGQGIGHGSGHADGHGNGQGIGHGNGHGHGHGHGHEHGHNKGDSPIYNLPISIGGSQPTSAKPSVTTTTVKPIGIDNPFFNPSGVEGADKIHDTGCSGSKPSSPCVTSDTGSDQGPVKIEQPDKVQTPNAPAFQTETNKGPGCGNNLHGNCGNGKPDGVGQHPSASGNKENLPNVGIIGAQNKPQLPDQQSTGQWPGAGNKPSSVDQGNDWLWPDAVNKPSSSNQQSPGQWPGAGNKPSLDQQTTGQWPEVGNKPSLDQQTAGQWPGSGNKPSSVDQSNDWLWPDEVNKPFSLNQQNTGHWSGNKPSSIGPQSGIQGDKNKGIESGTTYPASPVQPSTIDKDAIHFPKRIPPSDIHENINQGVKGGAHRNKGFGSIANSNAGASATGNLNIPNIPGAHNGNNNVPGSSGYVGTQTESGNGGSINNEGIPDSNALINGNNANNQHIPAVGNGAGLSIATANAGAIAGANAGANAGSYSNSFSSSQASSSSFASSQSSSYAASGDLSGVVPQAKGSWPFEHAKSLNLNSSWAKAASQASSFAANNSGRWSGVPPVAVQTR